MKHSSPDIEFTATVRADQLRFRERPNSDVRFSGTPGHKPVKWSRRTNLPNQVQVDVDYHDVRIEYTLENTLDPGA